MNRFVLLGALAAGLVLSGCGTSKKTFHYPLTTDNQKKLYDVCAMSKTFGQLDTWVQTDSPYHLDVRSGFYDRNHLSLSLVANQNKAGDAFSVRLKASGGKTFVRNVHRSARQNFMQELQTALGAAQ